MRILHPIEINILEYDAVSIRIHPCFGRFSFLHLQGLYSYGLYKTKIFSQLTRRFTPEYALTWLSEPEVSHKINIIIYACKLHILRVSCSQYYIPHCRSKQLALAQENAVTFIASVL